MGIKRNLEESGILDKQENITEDEAALYDRQIRLWGMECQKRLREAKILVVGLNGVGAEVVKNLTLSGMKSITILDDTEVSPADATAQFFVSGFSDQTGLKRAVASIPAIQELNPNVNISLCTGDIFSKPDTFYEDFHAMVATDCTMDTLIKLNELCRKHSIQFYCAETWGFYGYCFLDLNEHPFKWVLTEEQETPQKGARKGKKVSVKVTKEETRKYCPLGPTMHLKVGEGLKKRVNKVFILIHVINQFRELFNRSPSAESREADIEELVKLRKKVCEELRYDEKRISDEVLECMFGQLSPVCAAVGGVLTNEMIKGISRTGLPVHNYFLFDGNNSVGVNETIIAE